MVSKTGFINGTAHSVPYVLTAVAALSAWLAPNVVDTCHQQCAQGGGIPFVVVEVPIMLVCFATVATVDKHTANCHSCARFARRHADQQGKSHPILNFVRRRRAITVLGAVIMALFVAAARFALASPTSILIALAITLLICATISRMRMMARSLRTPMNGPSPADATQA